MALDGLVSFEVSVVGETTQEKWTGKFKAKPRLSHWEQIQKDKVRRELLGTDAASASERTIQYADIFSDFAARISLDHCPPWWNSTRGGLDLADDSVIAEVYTKMLGAIAEFNKPMVEKAEKAKKDLKKAAAEAE